MDTLDTYAAEALQRTEEVWEAIAKREIEDINYLIEEAIEFGRTYISFSVLSYTIRQLVIGHYEDRGYVVTNNRMSTSIAVSWAKEDPKRTPTGLQCIPAGSQFLRRLDKATYMGFSSKDVIIFAAIGWLIAQLLS